MSDTEEKNEQIYPKKTILLSYTSKELIKTIIKYIKASFPFN